MFSVVAHMLCTLVWRYQNTYIGGVPLEYVDQGESTIVIFVSLHRANRFGITYLACSNNPFDPNLVSEAGPAYEGV